MTGYSFTTPVWKGGQWVVPAVAEVKSQARIANGPEGQPRDEPVQWDKINWREQEGQVRRLRQRIFKASQEQDWAKVRNLQKLMLRSRANTLVSVRQVTQRNTGRRTAGIDGEVALTSEARAQVAVRVHQSIASWNPRAVRRVYIPKASNRAKLRPLGIPVLMDRCHQQRVRHALEPEWEARSEPRSYGFRPGRGCHDAIAVIYNACKGLMARRVWALDADLAAAFDRIDHDRLLASLGSFPARDMIRGWLKAGVLETGKGFAPTGEGTPQGGVITPPTQRATSASRPRWVTGGWSVAGERRAAGSGGGAGLVSETAWRAVGFRLPLDIICSIFLSCLGIAAQMPPSTRSMSTRPPGCWRPGSRRLRRPGCWPGGWAARSGRHAVTSPGLRNRAGLRSRTSPRCSRSGFPSGWPPRCGSTPGRPGAPSPRSPRRPWRSSSAALTGTIRRDEGAAGGGGIRLQPSRGGRNVSGLRHLGAAAAGQDRRPGGRRRKQ